MAEEFCGGANWWDSPSAANRSRFDCGGGSSTSSTTTTLPNGWLTDSTAPRSSLDSGAPATSSTLQLVGLGLDWNQQPLLRNQEKGDNSFRAMLQEGMGLAPNFPHDQTSGVFGGSQLQWRDKLFGTASEEASMESTVTCQQGFQLDSTSSSTLYGTTTTPSTILQGFIGSDQQTQQPNMNYQQNYLATLDNQTQSQLPASWAANKVPQFLRSTPASQFPNNTGASYLSADVRPSLMANSLQQPQLAIPSFEEKPKLQNTMEVRETSSTAVKKGGTENSTKRARSDTATSTLPPFKVRKEKMGDRITALQQLVSPFGKTDTASVLSEAIEYIRFLHEQVSVLSTPYLKSGAASFQQQQQGGEKAKVDPDGPKQDLRSRGLCLVPVSSTFPVTHESTVDFWTPTFGGTFR